VWAHNTHIGDASATELDESGYVSLGQLMRERHATAPRPPIRVSRYERR
jgi:erythromycin esterase